MRALLLDRLRRRLLERQSRRAVVGIWEIGALDHEDVNDAFDGVGPGLGAVGAAVAEGAGGEHRGHAFGFEHDASGTAPAVARFDKAGFQIAGKVARHELDGLRLEIRFSFERSTIQQHLHELGVIGCGGEQPRVGQRDAIMTCEVDAGQK